jgi:hypothetical protein
LSALLNTVWKNKTAMALLVKTAKAKEGAMTIRRRRGHRKEGGKGGRKEGKEEGDEGKGACVLTLGVLSCLFNERSDGS